MVEVRRESRGLISGASEEMLLFDGTSGTLWRRFRRTKIEGLDVKDQGTPVSEYLNFSISTSGT